MRNVASDYGILLFISSKKFRRKFTCTAALSSAAVSCAGNTTNRLPSGDRSGLRYTEVARIGMLDHFRDFPGMNIPPLDVYPAAMIWPVSSS